MHNDAPAAQSCDAMVIFVGGLKWFGVRWGYRRVPGGLADAGFTGQTLYWDWHRPVLGTFCLPIYCNRSLIESKAAELAAFLAQRRRERSEQSLHLIGCSAGGYIALRAAELLEAPLQVASLVLLSAAINPARDLAAARAAVRGPMINCSSMLDCGILGLGTMLLGTPDGRRGCAAGMVGFDRGEEHGLTELRWRWPMIFSGRLGGHSTCTPRAFIRKYVAPLMGLDS